MIESGNLYLGTEAGLMVNTLIEDPITALVGLVVPAIGAVVYFIFDKKLKAGKK